MLSAAERSQSRLLPLDGSLESYDLVSRWSALLRVGLVGVAEKITLPAKLQVHGARCTPHIPTGYPAGICVPTILCEEPRLNGVVIPKRCHHPWLLSY